MKYVWGHESGQALGELEPAECRGDLTIHLVKRYTRSVGVPFRTMPIAKRFRGSAPFSNSRARSGAVRPATARPFASIDTSLSLFRNPSFQLRCVEAMPKTTRAWSAEPAQNYRKPTVKPA